MIEIVKWRPQAMRPFPPRPPRLHIALMEGIVPAGKVRGILGIMLGIVVQAAAIITIMLKIAKKKKKNLACIRQIGGGQNVR